MTPEEQVREKAAQELADASFRRRELARRRFKHEEAAKRPAPVLVFDGEEDWRESAWLVDTIIPAEGAGMLFGESDVGKTFVAIHMAIPVCADLPWQGHAVAHGTVLFIEAEGTRSFALRKHAAKMAAGLGGLVAPFPFVTIYEPLGFGPDTTAALVLTRAAAIREAVANRALPPIRFVVVDTLAQNIQGDVDSNADMGAFLKLFRAFLKALSIDPVFGLLIHHPGHNNKDRARGAYALPADLDLIMRLESEDDVLTLSCDRMRDGERFAPILLALKKHAVMMDDERMLHTLIVVSGTETEADAKPPSPEAQIVKHLRLHPRQTTTQISTDLKIGKAAVVKTVDALCENNILRRSEAPATRGQTKQVYDVVPEAEHGL
jgi:hypothetical protein